MNLFVSALGGGKTTIIVVTHDRQVVRDVPKVLALQDGLIEATPPQAAARRRTHEMQALKMSGP